jgi:hypothetical protein
MVMPATPCSSRYLVGEVEALGAGAWPQRGATKGSSAPKKVSPQAQRRRVQPRKPCATSSRPAYPVAHQLAAGKNA